LRLDAIRVHTRRDPSAITRDPERALATGERDTPPSFEDYPLTRTEYITALVHYYRGERSRTDAWRARLDPTTNWAVVTTGGMLSFAFSSADHSHVSLLLANLLVSVFLGFEARRFRYFDVWRSRVRMLEENFFIPIIRRNLVSPRSDWRESVAEDLDRPKFKITFLQAVGFRLRYNYVWIFLVILAAWIAKMCMHDPSAANEGLLERAAVGPITGAFVLVTVIGFYSGVIWLALWARGQRGGTDEVSGLAKELSAWKT
jgi:uncharacterized membrane protein